MFSIFYANNKSKAMNYLKVLTIGFFFIFSLMLNPPDVKSQEAQEGALSVGSTPEFIQLTESLIEKYSRLNPGAEFQVQSFEAGKLSGNLGKTLDLGVTSMPSGPSEREACLRLLIARDVVVPVIHRQNPFLAKIEGQGVSPDNLAALFSRTGSGPWGELLEGEETAPVPVFWEDHPTVISSLSAFFKAESPVFGGMGSRSANEVIESVQNDRYAIGFCRFIDVLEPGSQQLKENIRLLPIDRNGNGTIDFTESIYNDLNDFRRGVWIGKYPGEMIQNVYAVVPSAPRNEAITDFVSWVLTDGQQFLESSGYSELVYSEKPAKLDKLYAHQITTEPSDENRAFQRLVFLILGLLLGATLLIYLFNLARGKNLAKMQPAGVRSRGVLNEGILKVPGGLFFDKTHTWVFMERDGGVRMGIDDFLQHVTGEYTRIKMKNPGEKVKKNEPIMSLVRDGKQIDICAPVSGTIREQNETLLDEPSAVNQSPYGEGWVYVIEPSNWGREIRFYKMAQEYRKWLTLEFARLRDFFAVSVNPRLHGQVVYQDGGEICDAVLQDLEPEVWEDFQKQFLDTSKL